jgi:hypothetical protein
VVVDEIYDRLPDMKRRAGIIIIIILAGNSAALVTWATGHAIAALGVYLAMIVITLLLFIEGVWAANRPDRSDD